MSINEKKTKFMVINNELIDKEDIISGGITVKYCTSYIYLGAPITDDGKYTSAINIHADEKIKHVMKFYSFLNRNPELPFPFKKKIAEACVLSTILYASETWLTENFNKLENIYHKIIKALLGVRGTTCNDTCLFEAGMPSFKALIEKQRKTFLCTKIPQISEGDPLKIAINLHRGKNTRSYRLIQNSLTATHDILANDIQKRTDKLKFNNSTKRTTYMNINPKLNYQKIYIQISIFQSEKEWQ